MTEKNKNFISAEDLYRMELITSAQIAPDGKKAVLSLQRVSQEEEKKHSNLWMVDIDSGVCSQFTSGDQSDTTPKWSPDGSKIAFISNGDNEKQPQIYLIQADGGERRKLTDLQGEFGSFAWAPDGKKFICQFRKKDEEVIEREKNEASKKLGVVARHIDRVFYRLDGYGWYPKERWHLWEIDTQSGEARQLTDHEIYDETGPFWSPDSQKVGYFSNRQKDPDLAPDAIDLFVLDLATGTSRKIETPTGAKGNGAFSPDGNWISYVGNQFPGEDWRNNNVWIVPADGSKSARDLTGEFDFHVNGGTLNDNGPAEITAPIWSEDSEWIYFLVARHGNTIMKKIHVANGSIEPVIEETGVVGFPSFAKNQNRLSFVFGQPQKLPQLFVKEINQNKEIRQLTDFNQSWFTERDLGEIEEVWFKGSDGNDLQGWILKPPDFDPTQKYPSILEIHGGPLLQYGNFFMHEFYYLAAQGYVVYFCNPRGGQGYGEIHSKAIYGGNWGTKDYEDLMTWVDYVEKLPYIDNGRMGVTGGSYGGYMTCWIIGHTNRFKAAVTQRCVSNLISMWGSSDYNWAFQEIFGNKAPYQDIATLWQCSPMKHIGNARTPTLVIHSEQDLRCPLEQGQQVFVALKKLGIPTKFVVFPEEPHGLSRMGRTDRRIVRLHEISGWFDAQM